MRTKRWLRNASAQRSRTGTSKRPPPGRSGRNSGPQAGHTAQVRERANLRAELRGSGDPGVALPLCPRGGLEERTSWVRPSSSGDLVRHLLCLKPCRTPGATFSGLLILIAAQPTPVPARRADCRIPRRARRSGSRFVASPGANSGESGSRHGAEAPIPTIGRRLRSHGCHHAVWIDGPARVAAQDLLDGARPSHMLPAPEPDAEDCAMGGRPLGHRARSGGNCGTRTRARPCAAAMRLQHQLRVRTPPTVPSRTCDELLGHAPQGDASACRRLGPSDRTRIGGIRPPLRSQATCLQKRRQAKQDAKTLELLSMPLADMVRDARFRALPHERQQELEAQAKQLQNLKKIIRSPSFPGAAGPRNSRAFVYSASCNSGEVKVSGRGMCE